jgi:hypothetical protein
MTSPEISMSPALASSRRLSPDAYPRPADTRAETIAIPRKYLQRVGTSGQQEQLKLAHMSLIEWLNRIEIEPDKWLNDLEIDMTDSRS